MMLEKEKNEKDEKKIWSKVQNENKARAAYHYG